MRGFLSVKVGISRKGGLWLREKVGGLLLGYRRLAQRLAESKSHLSNKGKEEQGRNNL